MKEEKKVRKTKTEQTPNHDETKTSKQQKLAELYDQHSEKSSSVENERNDENIEKKSVERKSNSYSDKKEARKDEKIFDKSGVSKKSEIDADKKTERKNAPKRDDRTDKRFDRKPTDNAARPPRGDRDPNRRTNRREDFEPKKPLEGFENVEFSDTEGLEMPKNADFNDFNISFEDEFFGKKEPKQPVKPKVESVETENDDDVNGGSSQSRNQKRLPKLTTRELQAAILGWMRKNPRKHFAPKQMAVVLGISNNRDSIAHAIEQLEASGKLYELKRGYDKDPNSPPPVSGGFSGQNEGQRPRRRAENTEKPSRRDDNPRDKKFDKNKGRLVGTHIGRVDMTKSGAAFIIFADFPDDVYVHQRNLNTALNDDKVEVEIYRAKEGKRPEGIVMRIVERGTERIIGTYRQTRRFNVVVPDQRGMPDVIIPEEDSNGATDGERVVAKIVSWGNRKDNNLLRGSIEYVLGVPGSRDIEMKTILMDKGFNIEFPEEVITESEKISEFISNEEIEKRRDFRHITTFTIDPEDAKDFDDAISFEVLKNGNIEIGVHIADVSHYMKPNTALDKEAYLRATSVYLVDRVCPMLPEKLSNGLCSLRPREEKLTFSAVFEFNETHKIVNRWFGKTVIYSDRRFTYDEAQQRLETGEGELADELMAVNKVALSLRKARFKNGAINFESDEVRFRLDEDGAPLEAYVKTRKDANLLVEDFMLLANREVSAFVGKKDKIEVPFIYRIHDTPNIDKLEEFATFAQEMGVKILTDTPKRIAKSINELVEKAAQDERLKLLAPIAIRCMAKAEYSTDNIGHYGLAFDYYSHFTSPIRRYSDVIAHRILEENLEKIVRFDKETINLQCKHISKQERRAVEAERESTKYYQIEYLSSRVGLTFEAQITGMVDRGLFAEILENRCEGMVTFDRLGEPFEVAESRLQARGTRSNKVYKMGDRIKIRVLSADLETKKIELDIVY
ncbi:MAG: hypothetical protein RL757_279 [Bacteroidota bacterium]|jgi:ribonuclease R